MYPTCVSSKLCEFISSDIFRLWCRVSRIAWIIEPEKWYKTLIHRNTLYRIRTHTLSTCYRTIQRLGGGLRAFLSGPYEIRPAPSLPTNFQSSPVGYVEQAVTLIFWVLCDKFMDSFDVWPLMRWNHGCLLSQNLLLSCAEHSDKTTMGSTTNKMESWLFWFAFLHRRQW